MASIELRPRGGYRIVFRYNGKKHSKTLVTRCEQTASLALAQLELNLKRVQLGKLTINPGEDLATALLGNQTRQSEQPRSPQKPTAREKNRKTTTKSHISLGEMLDEYLANIKEGSIESNTRQMLEIHVRHLKRIIGKRKTAKLIDIDCLQHYVDARSLEPGRRNKNVSPTTIRKEISTLSTVWKWALAKKLVSHPLAKVGLQYAKATQKPPFQTYQQIKQRIERGHLPEAQQADLWESVFLDLDEISVFLHDVERLSTKPFLFPLIAFVAHTGARRSEALRSQIDDIDFRAMVITIREKKRVKGHYSTRSVPMSRFLATTLENWFKRHPGGRFTFTLSVDDEGTQQPISRDQAADYFKRTLENSKWKVLPGYHVLRHSFCSNAAAKGVAQRLINSWVGHQREETVRRYRHLLPNREALESIFS